MEARTNPLGWPTWAWRGMQLLLLACLVWFAASTASNIARATGLLQDNGSLGAVLERPAGTPVAWLRVAEVSPGGAAAAAGLSKGDLVRFDWPFGYAVRNRAQWPNPITIERDGERMHSAIAVKGAAEPSGSRGPLILFAVRSLAVLAFGILLLIRGWRNRSAALLGMILIAFAAPSPILPWMPGVATGQVLQALTPITSIIAYLWIVFSLEISGGANDRRQAGRVQVLAWGFALASLVPDVAATLPASIPLVGAPEVLILPIIALNQLAGYAIIARNYRANDAPARNRIKIVMIAFLCFVLSTLVGRAIETVLDPDRVRSQLDIFRYIATLLCIAGLGLLAYGVLRRRLFDLNFALNRTLVYATVSFVLLAAFGIAKWAIEHLIPESWHEGSEYYSFGIALLLFLSLHRVHNWVERNIERVFFAPWHQNEQALRRFVAAAGHFDRTEVLCRAFAEEASRFAKGAGAALYLRSPDGAYGQSCGTLEGAEPADDDLALALMRAERGPVRIAETRTALPGALALPMLDHGKLAGFLLLGRKGEGSDYRPDEVEALGWAAHQVGLDLQAMRARELEAEVASLRERLARRGARKRGAAPVPLTAVSGGSAA